MRSALEEAQILAHSTAQGTRAQTTSYKLRVIIFWNLVCFLLCDINNFPISRNAFPIVVGGRGEKCKTYEKLHFICSGACDSPRPVF